MAVLRRVTILPGGAAGSFRCELKNEAAWRQATSHVLPRAAAAKLTTAVDA